MSAQSFYGNANCNSASALDTSETGNNRDQCAVDKKKKKIKLLTEEAKSIFTAWWNENHETNEHPSKDQQPDLCKKASATKQQLKDWFSNRRRKEKKRKREADASAVQVPAKCPVLPKTSVKKPQAPRVKRQKIMQHDEQRNELPLQKLNKNSEKKKSAWDRCVESFQQNMLTCIEEDMAENVDGLIHITKTAASVAFPLIKERAIQRIKSTLTETPEQFTQDQLSDLATWPFRDSWPSNEHRHTWTDLVLAALAESMDCIKNA